MRRSEYMTAQRHGLRMYRMRQEDTDSENGNNQNTFDLGDDLGRVRIDTDEIDESTSPSQLEGVMVRIDSHKTSATKGPAVFFLSLPDCVLMDAYDAIASR